MTYETDSNDSADTEKFGVQLGQKLRGGEVIELVSDLGGGKTTLVRGIALGAGSKDIVASPTFMIQKQYKCPKFTIQHFDLYRVGSDRSVIELTLAEEVESGNVTIVEWADQIPGALPKERIIIELRPDVSGEDVRKIICHYPDTLGYLFEGMK